MHSLLQPISLGPITLPNRIVQGPLAGYSCAPFRAITARIGEPGYCTTEMISAADLFHRNPKPHRYIWRDPEEQIVSYQLAGNKPEYLADAARIMHEAGADMIDLNCGCPVKKIRSKKSGSKLLQDPEHLYTLVRALREAFPGALSVKIRVGEPKHDSDDLAVAQAAVAGGADLLIVHGRHWTERYDVDCRYAPIAKLVQAVDIPVFANGDVDSPESALHALEQSQAAGLMIARASVGDPWLFQRIAHHLAGQPFTEPSRAEIGMTLLEHIQRLMALENEKLAILQSRKLAKYYARTLENRSEFVINMQQANTFTEAQQHIADYYGLD